MSTFPLLSHNNFTVASVLYIPKVTNRITLQTQTFDREPISMASAASSSPVSSPDVIENKVTELSQSLPLLLSFMKNYYSMCKTLANSNTTVSLTQKALEKAKQTKSKKAKISKLTDKLKADKESNAVIAAEFKRYNTVVCIMASRGRDIPGRTKQIITHAYEICYRAQQLLRTITEADGEITLYKLKELTAPSIDDTILVLSFLAAWEDKRRVTLDTLANQTVHELDTLIHNVFDFVRELDHKGTRPNAPNTDKEITSAKNLIDKTVIEINLVKKSVQRALHYSQSE